MNDPLKIAAQSLNEAAPPGERLAFVNPLEEAGLKAAGGQGKPAAGGIPSYKKGDVEAPPPRDYGQETADTLESQIRLAPDLYASEERFRPQYANLERRIQLEQLGIDPEIGLLEAFEDYIAPSLIRQERAGVEGDIAMLRQLGPELVAAQRAADPLAESLRQSVMTEALEDMQAGGGMTAEETRDLDEQTLAMAAQRGLVGQNVSDYARMKAKVLGDRGVKAQRMQNAAAAHGMDSSDALLGLTGQRMGTGANVAQQFGTAGYGLESSPAIFNPESAYAGALSTQNWQGQMDARTASAANRAAMTGALLGAGASIAGAGLGKGGRWST
jgi:hypothetical protein